MIPYKKGKRGLIFLEERKGKKVIVKKKNPKAAVDTINNEAEFLKILNKHNIGPKLLKHDVSSITMEFIDGTLIGDYFENEKNNKKEIIKMIIKILEQCRQMDKLGINKLEMTRPHKHIIVRDDAPILIDFERCRKTEKPKNVTQFLQFLTSTNISKKLEKNGIVIDKDNVIRLSKDYKSNMNRVNFERIISLIEND